MTEYLTIFLAGFVSVFALGVNSRNVNNGDYYWAASTSLFIGLSQAMLWKHITAESAGITGSLVYAVSGAVAIVAAMWTHKRFIHKP